MTTPKFITIGKRAKQITGQRFGRLVALGPVDRDRYAHILWLCQCDCGNQCVARASDLDRGFTTSCGCVRCEMAAEMGRNTKVYVGLSNEEVRRRANERYHRRHPNRNKANKQVTKAIKAGILPPAETEFCFACGSDAHHYHHVDYSKPMEVIPVCRSCHRQWHMHNDPIDV